jgi:hypothetical protein
MTDLAHDLDTPLTTLHREVERLEEAGLLTSRRVGRTRLLRANTGHPAARPLAELLTVTFGPTRIIAEEFAGLGVDRVIIFGPWPRRFAGERGGFPKSVDILVVCDYTLRKESYRVAEAAARRLGFDVNPVIRSPGDWENEPYDALVTDIRNNEFIQVLGPPTDEGYDEEPSRLIYRLRPPWRPRFEPDVFVPADLDLLSGPTSGVFDPPVNLYWQPGELDFGSPTDLKLFYSAALTKASTPEQFNGWVNACALTANWSALSLPSRVRQAWETIHPQLRRKDTDVNARTEVQDTILTAIAHLGFALAGGSALLDYDVVNRETEDIDVFFNGLDADAFTKAAEAVIAACRSNGWSAELVHDQDLDKQVKVTVGSGDSVVVQFVHHQRSTDPEHRAAGGLRLIFDDVVGGKAAAAADSARGRDFDDIANVVDTPGWSLDRVADCLKKLGYPDRVAAFWANLERFRRGEFDEDIRQQGFDPTFSHRILDEPGRAPTRV